MITSIKICPICHKQCEFNVYSDDKGVVEILYKCKCGGIHWSYGHIFSKKPKWYQFIRKYRYKKYLKREGLEE